MKEGPPHHPGVDPVITTPAGSTIVPVLEGGYRVCDRHRHCRRVDNLWQAQQLIRWAEVHHCDLDSPSSPQAVG